MRFIGGLILLGWLSLEAVAGDGLPTDAENIRGGAGKRIEACFQWSAELAYPEFGHPVIDERVRAIVYDLLAAHAAQLKETIGPYDHPDMSGPGNGLWIDYQATWPSSKVVSVILRVSGYNPGAAHGWHMKQTYNFSIEDGEELTLDKLFRHPEKALAIFAQLAPKLVGEIPSFMEGFEATPDNYAALSLEPDGVRVHFQEYQVAPYASGLLEALIPLAALEEAGPGEAVWKKSGDALDREADKAPAEGRELSLKIADAAIEVYSAANPAVLLQRLPFDPEAMTDQNREYFAVAEDMNFDAWPDVRIISSQGLQNILYDCWLWRPETRIFAKDEELGALSSPRFNPAGRRITTYAHVSAMANSEGELTYENGKLVWLKKVERDYDHDNDQIILREYGRGPEGTPQLTSEKSLPREEYEEGLDNPSGSHFFLAGMPEETVFRDSADLSDGSWWREEELPGIPLRVESRRLHPIAPETPALEKLIQMEWPEARELKIA
ncbi:MAG: RsiV family protein, partial [Planctomycetota bacterium]|nr:RsiV family protein [Planctomycetota bacterium]